jgi:Uma2 family endonuclease
MLTLPRSLSLTSAQFAEVCAAKPESVLELDADGSLIKMTSSGSMSNARNSALVFQRRP